MWIDVVDTWSIAGSGSDWDDMEPEQGMGRPLGRLERQPVCTASDWEHGKFLAVNIQETQQDEQGVEGCSRQFSEHVEMMLILRIQYLWELLSYKPWNHVFFRIKIGKWWKRAETVWISLRERCRWLMIWRTALWGRVIGTRFRLAELSVTEQMKLDFCRGNNFRTTSGKWEESITR